ncbi:MAG TPA: GWxTD domain-containing protein [Gemmatimonadales bacterium]|nr:GWxTD domain-containing protein [Gemmatimonadales bacterium]
MLRAFIRSAALAAVLSGIGAGPGRAQAPPERVDVERLRDSLGGVVDSVPLKRLEAATIEVAKRDRDNPLIHLRLGFIAYRLGEIAKSKPHYDDAAGEFEWASDLKPDWPYPWYGLGLAELAQGENSSIAIENLRQQLGLDYLSKAARAFARATQADPSFAFAAVDLANAALSQRIRPRLEVALQSIRLAAASPAGANPAVQLARGRMEREMGEVDSALAAFRAFLSVDGDSGIGLFELARTQFFANERSAAESSYYTGARIGTSAVARALYRGDLALLADSAELRDYDAQPDGRARAAWLARFWDQRDVVEAREPGERLAEHNRRWLYAHRNFRLVSRHRHYDITEVYRSSQAEFDDRGIIYLRHGEPDQRATYPSDLNKIEPNQSWLYRRPSGDIVFHFVARDDASDYKLVESLVDAMGFRAAVQAAGHPDPSVIDLYASREQFGGTYARVARGGSLAGAALADERVAGRHDIVSGTTTDSYQQRFPVSLNVVVSDFVVGNVSPSARGDSASIAVGPGGDGATDRPRPTGSPLGTARPPDRQTLHVVFAIPADRLSSEPGGEGVLYPLHFRLVVTDLHDSLVARLDTLRVFTAHQVLHAPSYLSGRLSLPVPVGAFRYRLLVSTTDQLAGQLVVRDTVRVPALDGRSYAASDVVMGRLGGGLVWLARRPAGDSTAVDSVLLNPLDRYPAGSTVELYFEVYGLAPGQTYHTEVRVERQGGRSVFGWVGGLFGGHHAPALLAFDASADGPVTRVHRGLSLKDVPTGNYVLTVTLTDPASTRRIVQRQSLQVVSSQ